MAINREVVGFESQKSEHSNHHVMDGKNVPFDNVLIRRTLIKGRVAGSLYTLYQLIYVLLSSVHSLNKKG